MKTPTKWPLGSVWSDVEAKNRAAKFKAKNHLPSQRTRRYNWRTDTGCGVKQHQSEATGDWNAEDTLPLSRNVRLNKSFENSIIWRKWIGCMRFLADDFKSIIYATRSSLFRFSQWNSFTRALSSLYNPISERSELLILSTGVLWALSVLRNDMRSTLMEDGITLSRHTRELPSRSRHTSRNFKPSGRA